MAGGTKILILTRLNRIRFCYTFLLYLFWDGASPSPTYLYVGRGPHASPFRMTILTRLKSGIKGEDSDRPAYA